MFVTPNKCQWGNCSLPAGWQNCFCDLHAAQFSSGIDAATFTRQREEEIRDAPEQSPLCKSEGCTNWTNLQEGYCGFHYKDTRKKDVGLRLLDFVLEMGIERVKEELSKLGAK